MKTIITRCVFTCCILVSLCVSDAALALNSAEQRTTKQLASGSWPTIQRAAEDMYNNGLVDKEVSDVAAEVLLQVAAKHANGDTQIDAMSWLCRALGNTGDGRYKELLNSVAKEASNRKMRKYCEGAAKQLPQVSEPAYQPGSIELAKYRDDTAPKPSNLGKTVNFNLIKAGMSREEVWSLIGPPQSTKHQTTYKAGLGVFNPSGKDSQREYALYKGAGQLLYSNSGTTFSGNASVMRVKEIIDDSTETGFQ